jgi:hypothetical protein
MMIRARDWLPFFFLMGVSRRRESWLRSAIKGIRARCAIFVRGCAKLGEKSFSVCEICFAQREEKL